MVIDRRLPQTGDTKMSATEILTKMHQDVQAELINVRRDYQTLALATQLARRHGLRIEDAMMQEAKQRCRRNSWAIVTGK